MSRLVPFEPARAGLQRLVRLRSSVIPAAVLVFGLVGAVAHARPGDLDGRYSADGYARPALARTSIPFAVEIDKQGRTVAVGNSGGKNGTGGDEMLIVLGRDGEPPRGFGSEGVIIGEGKGSSYLYDVAIDDANRIVAVGRFGSQAVAVRYTPKGTPDTSFGDSGVVELGSGYGSATAIRIDEEDRLVILFEGASELLQVARVRPDGELDAEFSADGIADAGIPNENPSYNDGGLAIDQRNSVLVSDGPKTSRLTAAGELDPTFGDGGVAELPLPNSSSSLTSISDLVIDSAGRPLVGGEKCFTGRDGYCLPILGRLTVSGGPDGGFGRDGVVSPSLVGYVSGLEPIAGGRILLGGAYFDFYGGDLGSDDYFVGMFNATGSPVKSFAQRGISRTDFAFTSERAQDFAVKGRRAVVGGMTIDNGPGYFNPLFARYRLDRAGIADADADFRTDPQDQCPRSHSRHRTGCPLVAREIDFYDSSGSEISGDLAARSGYCAAGRIVALYRVQRGADQKIRVTKTSDYGTWRFRGLGPGDVIYVRAREQTVAKAGRCAEVRSQSRPIKPR